MKKLIISVFTMILSLCMLVGCTNNQNANNQGGNIPDIPSGGSAGTATIPDELTEIPSQYNQVAERRERWRKSIMIHTNLFLMPISLARLKNAPSYIFHTDIRKIANTISCI